MTSEGTPRIRLFAGPNGSGKSTLLDILNGDVPLYRVINPDEIEKSLHSKNGLDISGFGISAREPEFDAYVACTSYGSAVKKAASRIRFSEQRVFSRRSRETSYNAALLAGFIRSKLVQKCISFSYESVFSHESKLHELSRALKLGYRIYLYFIAMDAPELCVGRVNERVARGGHDVPELKIKQRFTASLHNLLPALSLAYRAYVFDNSGREAVLLAEKTPEGNLHLRREQMPVWFDEFVTSRLPQP